MKIQVAFRQVRRFLRVNEAVSALEYAILVGIIAVGLAAALITFSDNIEDSITGIGTKVKTGAATAETAKLKDE